MTPLTSSELTVFLQLRRLPARLNAAQVGAVLGFPLHDITVLTTKKMLRTLGKPAQNSTKYYAAKEIESLAGDLAWLNKTTKMMNDFWKAKNGGRNPTPEEKRMGGPLESTAVQQV